jgi:hypothetical protein
MGVTLGIVIFGTSSRSGLITCLGGKDGGREFGGQLGWDGRPEQQVAGVGGHADVASDLDALDLADSED